MQKSKFSRLKLEFPMSSQFSSISAIQADKCDIFLHLQLIISRLSDIVFGAEFLSRPFY